MEYKVCSKCKMEKNIEDFHRSRTTKDGFQGHCKICQSSYYKNNIEARKKYKAQYYIENKTELQVRYAEYYKSNMDDILQKRRNESEKWKKYNSEYKKKRLSIDPYFKFLTKLRASIANNIRKLTNGKTIKNSKGIDYKAIFEHIGPRPDNTYHLDHIIPISKFDLNNPKHVILAHLPINLRWIPAKENLSKSNKIPDIVYTDEKLLNILKEIENEC